jgi:hypothetical protein
MPWSRNRGGSVNSLLRRDLRDPGGAPERERKRAPCEMQRRPPACNVTGGYFLAATARLAAARYRRFTSFQLMFRMKASRYALRSLP